MWAAVGMAVVSGALMATQAKVNGELGHRLDNGFMAATISFGSGLVILAVLVSALPAGRRGIVALTRSVRKKQIAWWALFGGFGGALLVLSQSLTSSILGVAMFTIAVIGGQTLSGLILDQLGMAPGGRRRLTASRIIGAFVTVAAVAVSLWTHVSTAIPIPLLVLPFAAGLAIAWQQAVNGRVSVAAGSVLTSTFVNFLAGTLALLGVLAVTSSAASLPAAYPAEWWLYTGGILGIGFIFGLAVAVKVTGVLVLGMATVVGQLSTAIILDLLSPSSHSQPDFTTVVSTLIVFGSVLLSAPRRANPRLRKRRHAKPNGS